MSLKRQYLALCMTMPRDWLQACLRDPSPYQRPIHIAITAYLAAMKAEGFVMVPVEPTEAMIRAAWAVEDSAPRHQVMTREMYIAMIAARPKGEVK